MPGDLVYFLTYYRDQLAGQLSQYTVYRPDGSLWRTWSHASSRTHYSSSWWYWSFVIGSSEPTGLWRFEVVYEGRTYEHFFTVQTPEAGRIVEDTPLMVTKATGDQVTVSWGASCVPEDRDFALETGELGNYYSHVPWTCTTGGSTSVTLRPVREQAYYLVVPQNGVSEGSYGLDSLSAERLPSTAACLTQRIATCP